MFTLINQNLNDIIREIPYKEYTLKKTISNDKSFNKNIVIQKKKNLKR